MFGIGMPEMMIILAVALIVIGPKKLPDLAKSLGRAINEFKKASTDFKESIEIDDELDGIKKAYYDTDEDNRISDEETTTSLNNRKESNSNDQAGNNNKEV